MNFYGLKTCDTCRKARKELDAALVAYEFHDVRDDGVSGAQIARWAKRVGWENLLNKSSTTWRSLANADKEGLSSAKAIALMARNPTLMKRPIIERGDTEIFVGWTRDVEKTLTGGR